MKNLLKVLSPKRLPVYFLLLAILATAVVFLPSCKSDNVCTEPSNQEGNTPSLLFNDENNPPVSITFHRKAEGSYVTGHTEADNMSVTMQMNSKTAESIYAWLTHFTVGEEITEAEGYSPFYFTVKYEKGEEAHFGFYDCEINGKKYAIEFTEGATDTQGEADWQEVMGNIISPYCTKDTPLLFLKAPTDLRLYTGEDEGYNKWEHVFEPIPEVLLLPISGSGVHNMPGGLPDELNLFSTYPYAGISPTDDTLGGGMFHTTEPNIISGSTPYQVVTFPTLINENGEIKVSRTKGVCDLICDELLKWVEDSGKDPDGHVSNNDVTLEADYDWTGHIFPQPKDNDIVKIEIARDAYGAMASGIEEIDHVRIDIKETYDRGYSPENLFLNAKDALKSLVYDKEVIPSAVEDVNYQYRIIATYADGTVIDCPIPYAEKDGKKYSIKRRSGITTGDTYTTIEIRIQDAQWDILKEMGYSTETAYELMDIGSGKGDTATLYSSDGAVSTSLPPNNQTYPEHNSLPNFFLIEISEPDDLICNEYVVEETADGTRKATYYAGSGGIVKYEKDGASTWYRAPLLSDNSGDIFSFTYPDNVVAIFHFNMESNILVQ